MKNKRHSRGCNRESPDFMLFVNKEKASLFYKDNNK